MATDIPPGTTPFEGRKHPKVLCMFDVDDTLTRPRQLAKPEVVDALKKLKEYCAIAFVGGSDLGKITEQLKPVAPDGEVTAYFDYGFAENGLTAFKAGKQLPSASFIQHVGEEEYKKLANFILRYLSDVDVPVKRGTFIEFRKGMINVSPIGRNASKEERDDFEKFDNEHNIRKTMVAALKEKFAHLKLTYSIGGQISFDVFPQGWDKTYSLNHVEKEGFEEIHFFGDKTYEGGNDHEIFSDPRTIGHTVKNPDDTVRQLNELFHNKA
ncbi:Phosphomannomutase 1 [Cryptotrichosporon argae]